MAKPTQSIMGKLKRRSSSECQCSCGASEAALRSPMASDRANGNRSEHQIQRWAGGYRLVSFISLVLIVLLSIYIRSVYVTNGVGKTIDRKVESEAEETGIRPWPIMASFETVRKERYSNASPGNFDENVLPDADSSALSVVRVNVRIHKPPQLTDGYVIRRNTQQTNRIEAQQALRVASELRVRLEGLIERSRERSKQNVSPYVHAYSYSSHEPDSMTPTSLSNEFDTANAKVRQQFDESKLGKRSKMDLSQLDETSRVANRRLIEKTRKLLEHAFVLDPDSSDVLTALGSFFETFDGDWVKAEHLYARALTRDPAHSGALASRARCLPIVAELDQRRFKRIDTKLQALFTASGAFPNAAASLARTSRERYVRIVYHNNAIEGNSLTLIQTRVLLETRIAIGGKSLLEQNEVLGLDAALMFINSTLLRRSGPIRLSDILELHRRVLGFVDLEQAGRLRDTQVFVGSYKPPVASELPVLMRELVDWLNSPDAQALHPIELAALAHWKLVYVHPFYDGNGRTARLLANWLLMRSGFPPIIVQVQERYKYYRMIELANDGDVRPFIRFIAALAERAIDDFVESITSPVARSQADMTDTKAQSHQPAPIGVPNPDELRALDDPEADKILIDTYQQEQVDPKILDFVGG